MHSDSATVVWDPRSQMHGRSEELKYILPLPPFLLSSLLFLQSIIRFRIRPRISQYLISPTFPIITLIHTTLTGPNNNKATTMKTSLLTTPLVLALGLKSVTALPTATDTAVQAEAVLAPAAVAETLARPSTPALGIMEKRTFNPLRGCWKHHCKKTPFPPPLSQKKNPPNT